MSRKNRKSYIVILVVASSLKEAKKIAQALLVKKEAACVNIIRDISSFFWWQGKIQKAREVLLLIKTSNNLFNKALKTVRKGHSYSVPEIIALPIKASNKAYLEWIEEVTLD